jgi:bacteriocin biosynthesis cyclodehydratase domain-containing protein
VSRPSLPRPTLLPGLRPLWRDRHTVQLGTDPEQAMVLEFPHPAAAKLLELLDGSRTERAITDEMGRIGMPAADVHEILTAMIEAGLVVAAHTLMPSALPADQRKRIGREATALALRFRERPASPATILRRRYAARVIIADDGPFARLLAPALLEAGVGKVGRVTEAGGAATSVASGQSTPIRADDAFVVQVGRMTRIAIRGSRQRNPHLAIGVRDGVAIVGPLVPPTGGPCLRCLDLHRADRDPAWPRLAAQLADKHAEPTPCTAATLLTAAGFAAAEVLTYLDGGLPSTIGTTVEINGALPWRRRTWTPHARCDCTRRAR